MAEVTATPDSAGGVTVRPAIYSSFSVGGVKTTYSTYSDRVTAPEDIYLPYTAALVMSHPAATLF